MIHKAHMIHEAHMINQNPNERGTRLKYEQYLKNLKGKRVAVIGAGISNTPLIETLLGEGLDTTVHDKRACEELGQAASRFEQRGAKLALGERYLENLNADIVFRTPGIMPTNPALVAAVAQGAQLTSEMEVFFNVCPCKIIGITGSDGKTTTTSIIAQMLRNEGREVYLGGNIGTPLLREADDMSKNGIAVVELSSFQLITMEKCPDIAVVTNLAPNHLDVHKDMDEYVAAKRNIFIQQKSTDEAVFNLDNEYTRAYAEEAPGTVRFFSRLDAVSSGAYLEGGTIYLSEGGKAQAVLQASDILLPGTHNIENYMAAIAAVKGLVSKAALLHTAKTFKGVAHRIEFVRQLRGVRYYNDSIASSPTRSIAGMLAFDQKVILIAGGKGKGLPFEAFGALAVSRVKKLMLTGPMAGEIRSAVESSPGYEGQPEIQIHSDFEGAVLAAAGSAQEGDIVLLSPACTSFDRFKNFEERGELFREIIEGLI